MNKDPFGAVQPAHREIARSAFAAAFGSVPIGPITLVSGGASGASLLRMDVGERPYLMRVEGPTTPLLRRNRHRYVCTRIAAEAEIAPALHYVNEVEGVAVTDFIVSRPLTSFPGGAAALAEALGTMLRRLQASALFPQLVYYPDLVTRMFDHVRESGGFADGVLDRHVERLAAIREVCDFDTSTAVPSHNDLNPGNILFDGARLWLIDWESAYRNHPLVDVAILLDNLTPSSEVEDVLLRAWLGRAPDRELTASLDLIRPLTRLYYACFLLNASATPGAELEKDISAPSPLEFGLALREGRLGRGDTHTIRTLGKILLDGFCTGIPMPGLSSAVAALIGGG